MYPLSVISSIWYNLRKHKNGETTDIFIQSFLLLQSVTDTCVFLLCFLKFYIYLRLSIQAFGFFCLFMCQFSSYDMQRISKGIFKEMKIVMLESDLLLKPPEKFCLHLCFRSLGRPGFGSTLLSRDVTDSQGQAPSSFPPPSILQPAVSF